MSKRKFERPEYYRYQVHCHNCRRLFGARRRDARFCSDKCRVEAWRKEQPTRDMDAITRDRLQTKRTRRYELKCLECGRTFYRDGTGTASLYCSNACKQAAYRARQREKQRQELLKTIPGYRPD